MATKSATAFVMLIATFLISLLAFASNNLSGGFVPHVAKADDHTKNANIRGLYNNNISNDNNKLRGRRRLTDDNDDEDDESSQLVFDSSTPEAAVESEEAFLADAVDTLTRSEVNEKVLEENTLEPNEEDALNESVEELAEAVENLAVEKEELEEQEPEEGVEEMIITTVPNVNVNEGGDEEEEEEGQQQQEVAKQEDENSSETTAVFGGGGDDGENTVLSTPSPSPDVLSNEQDDASEEEEKEVISTPNPTTRPTVKEESWYDVENSPTNEPEPGENNDEWGENNDEWGESKDDDWGENGEDDEWGENGEDEWGEFSNLGPTDKPTPRPTAIYVPKEGDPLQSEEEPDVKDFNDDVIYHGLGGKVGAYLDQVESPQEMEYDKNVQITAGILGSLTLVILLVTAHLVMNHPDGLCAGCCRLVLKVICCFTRTLCLPCRAICCKGSEQSSGRRTHQPMRTPFPTDLELS